MIQFMSRGNRARRWTPAIVLAVVTTVGGMSRAAGPAASTSQGSQQELLDEVRALRAEVDALKAARGQELRRLQRKRAIRRMMSRQRRRRWKRMRMRGRFRSRRLQP